MQLLDEVGIDVGSKIGPILQAELGERFAPPAAFSKLIADGRLGKKAKKGFYQYNTKSKKKLVDEGVYSSLGLQTSNKAVSEAQVERCVYMMLNEAARCLDEGIIRNARDGDIGAIFGIGFPPFLGGPFNYIDKIGAVTLVSKLNQWQAEFGERFAPCDALVKMAQEGESYYSS